jgi:pyruvate, water dikinase
VDSARLLYRLEDLTKDDGDVVGKKCANLGELTRAEFPVPLGFALSLLAYERFFAATGLGGELESFFSGFDADPSDPKEIPRFNEASLHVQGLIEAEPLPPDIEEIVRDHYRSLAKRVGGDDVRVAVRSAGPASHPGQYDSYLNVSGEDGVFRNIIKVWASTFNPRSIMARGRKGLPLHRDPIGVCVLQMVDARAAGVMFTAEPTTGDNTKAILEGSQGLGESVVSGSVIPDVWIVDTNKSVILDRRIVAAPGGGVGGCLNDEEVIALAAMGARVEQHFRAPQDIEWAVVGEPGASSIHLLQTRNEKFSIRFAGF